MYGANVTGVELSQVGVNTAKKIAEINGLTDRCQFIQGDFSKADFDAESFDIVVMHEVYHHLIKYPGVKEKIKNLLKADGCIIMADTVRVAGPIHLGRKILNFFRRAFIYDSKRREEALGDVLFPASEYHKFAEGFSSHKAHYMSYFYMVKQTFLKFHVDKWYVRFFLRLTKYFDDVFLALFPFFKKGCGEAILFIRK